MTKLPRVRGSEVVAALIKVGFDLKRVRGSHHILGRDTGQTIVIPVHAGEEIGPGLLRRILRDAELTPEQFRELL